MSETDLTPEEQKYFDTQGDESPEEQAVENTETEESPVKEEKAPEEKVAEEKEKVEKVVPYGALHEERMRRKELQERLDQEAEKRAKMEARFEEFQKRFQVQEEVPDFETDPANNLKHELGATKEEIAQLRQWREQQEQAAKASEQERQFLTAYKASATQFMEQNKDFSDAYRHWYSDVMSELQEAGWTDAAQMRAQAEQWERGIAMKAMQDGVNPAERLYKLAQKRGYKRAEPSSAVNDAARALDPIAKGQKAAKSLSGGGGDAPKKTTLESLAQLDDDEFEQIAGDPKKWAKLWQ